MSDSDARMEIVGALGDEFVDRLRRGERTSLNEYKQNHPDFADEIEELFPALAMMEDLAPQDRESLGLGTTVEGTGIPELQQLGDYRIIREVGRGGMGVVYEAEQISLGRHVALKVLPSAALPDSRHVRRFVREAKSAAKLHHTNIVPVFGVGEQDGLHYYVMQFIQGLPLDEVIEELKKIQAPPSGAIASSERSGKSAESLERHQSVSAVAHSLMTGQFAETFIGESDFESDPGAITTNPEASAERDDSSVSRISETLNISGSLSGSTMRLKNSGKSFTDHKQQTYWQSVAHIGVQVAHALVYAHEQGIVHRDIKPSNLLLDMQGTVWVTDFGLAKANDQQDITHTGDILGTLRYMPPEAFEGRSDASGDQYSLGLTLYELLVHNKPAFDERDHHQLIKLVTTAVPTRIDKLNPAVPRDLATIVHKAIDRDPKHRYASAGEMADDLERFLADEPIKARRLSMVERFSRWSRQNKGLAVSLSVISALVMIFALSATVAAGYFQNVAGRNAELARNNEALADQQTALAKQNEEARAAAEEVKTQIEKQANELERQYDRAQERLVAAQNSETQSHLISSDGGDARRSLAAVIPKAGEQDRRGWEWYYLNRWLNSASRSYRGHSQNVAYAVAFSPDDRLIASAGGGNTHYLYNGRGIVPGEVIVREFVTGRVLHRLTGHKNWVEDVAFSPDRNLLATVGRDQAIICWDTHSGAEVFRMDVAGTSETGRVEKVDFSPDGRHLLTISKKGYQFPGTLAVYSIEQKRVVHQVPGMCADFSLDGSSLYFSDWKTVKSLDIASGAVTDFLSSPLSTRQLWGLKRSPQGTFVAAAVAYTGQVLIWDLRTKQVVRMLPAEERTWRFAFTQDESLLCTSGDSTSVQIWGVKSAAGSPVATLPGTELVTGISFSADGNWLATSDFEGWIRAFRTDRDPRGSVIRTGQGQMPGLTFSDDGTKIRTANWEENRADKSRAVSTWEIRTGKSLSNFHTEVEGGRYPMAGFAFSPDGRRLAAARHGAASTVTIWDADNGEELLSLTAHPDRVDAVVFSRDGDRLATASGYELRIWEATTGRLLHTHQSSDVSVVAFSPDGELIATGGYSAGVSIRDVQTGEVKFHFAGTGKVFGLEFSLDGKRLAAADYGRWQVTVWDTKQGKQLTVITGIRAASDVAWSPDGTRLAAIGYDGDVHLIHGEMLEELILLRTLGSLPGDLGFSPRVVFSPDGTKIAGNSAHGEVTVWEAGDGYLER